MKIYPLGAVPQVLYPGVGGKAKGLDLLVRNGFTVPAGFVITDLDTVEEEAVYQAFDALDAKLVSVRSSASNEDSSEASNAGQYETCLFVDRAHLVESVQKCLAFLYPIDAQSVPEGLVRSVRLFLQDYRQYLLPGVAVLATGLSLVVGRKASNS